MEAFWPGALTLVLDADETLTWDLGETGGTLAVRMPAHGLALNLLRRSGPLAVSSATPPAHRPPPTPPPPGPPSPDGSGESTPSGPRTSFCSTAEPRPVRFPPPSSPSPGSTPAPPGSCARGSWRSRTWNEWPASPCPRGRQRPRAAGRRRVREGLPPGHGHCRRDHLRGRTDHPARRPWWVTRSPPCGPATSTPRPSPAWVA